MSYIYPCDVHNVSDSFQDHVNRGSVNPGTDYTASKGSDVRAIASGVVRYASANNNLSGSGGRVINIFHDDGSSSDYLHLSRVDVIAGKRVAQGERIGLSGASGYGRDDYYGAHLHISFRPNNQIDWFGNVGNVDFDAVMNNTTPANTGDIMKLEEDPMIKLYDYIQPHGSQSIYVRHPSGISPLFNMNPEKAIMDRYIAAVNAGEAPDMYEDQLKQVDIILHRPATATPGGK